MKNSKLKIIAGGALIALISMIFGKGLSYLYLLLLARTGTSNYGILNLGFVIVSILIVFSLIGINQGLLRYVAYYKGKNNKSKIKGVIFSAIKITLPLSIFFSILLFLLADFIAINLFHNLQLSPILKIFSFTIPFIVLTNLILDSITALQKIFYSNLNREFIERILKIIFAFIAIYFGYELIGMAFSYLLAIFVSFFSALYFLNKKVFNIFNKKIKANYVTKNLLLFSYPLSILSVLTLLLKWTDTLMIGYFKTTSDVGIYNASLPTANLLVIVPAALMAIFTPVIIEIYSRRGSGEVKLLSKRISKWIFYFNVPLFLFLLIFSKDFLRIMFGQDYVIGYSALIILLFGHILHSLSHVPSSVLLMIKKTKIIMYVGIITAVLNIILNYFLIPRYNINGAAIATSSSLILNMVFLTLFSYKLKRIQPFNLNFIKAIISGILTTIILYIILRLFLNINSIYNLALLGIIFLLIYLIILYILRGFDKEDKGLLNTLLKKLINRF